MSTSVAMMRTSSWQTNFCSNKLLGLVGDITQMLHQGGRTRGIMPPVMLRYVQITLGLILCTPPCISVGGMFQSFIRLMALQCRNK
jgi:hypothetical protein